MSLFFLKIIQDSFLSTRHLFTQHGHVIRSHGHGEPEKPAVVAIVPPVIAAVVIGRLQLFRFHAANERRLRRRRFHQPKIELRQQKAHHARSQSHAVDQSLGPQGEGGAVEEAEGGSERLDLQHSAIGVKARPSDTSSSQAVVFTSTMQAYATSISSRNAAET